MRTKRQKNGDKLSREVTNDKREGGLGAECTTRKIKKLVWSVWAGVMVGALETGVR